MINLTLKPVPVLTLKIKEPVEQYEPDTYEGATFTDEEREFIKISFEKGVPTSRIAFKLNKDYDDVELEMISLGLMTHKQLEARINSKYATRDEIDYKLLIMGNSETEIRTAHEKSRLFPTKTSVDSSSESYE